MNIENLIKGMDQRQLNNLDKILKTPNVRNVFDFNNQNVINFIKETLVKSYDKNLESLCMLIKDNKVLTFNQAVDSFLMLEKGLEVFNSIPADLSIKMRYKFHGSEDDYSPVHTPLDNLLSALYNYSSEPNVLIVAETFAYITDCDIGEQYYCLLSYSAFWSDTSQVIKFRDEFKNHYQLLKNLIFAEKNKGTFFYERKVHEALVKHCDNERSIMEYMSRVIGKYNKSETISNIKKLMDSD